MQQFRPLFMEGIIGAKKYMGENVFLLDREHPDEALRGAAERVLVEVGGFAPGGGGPGAPPKITQAEREALTELVCQALADLAGMKGEKLHRAREKAREWVMAHEQKALLTVLSAGRQRVTDTLAVSDLPRFLCLAVELTQEADLDIRESHRALYEALALEIRGCRPDLATPAMILAHLRGLRTGQMQTQTEEPAQAPATPAAPEPAAAPPTPERPVRGGRLRIRNPKDLADRVDESAPVVRDPPAPPSQPPAIPATIKQPVAQAEPTPPPQEAEALKIPEGVTLQEFFKKGPLELAALVPGPEANRGAPEQRLDPGTAGADVQLGTGTGGRIKLKRFKDEG